MIRPKNIRPSEPVDLQDHKALSKSLENSRLKQPFSPFNSSSHITLLAEESHGLSGERNENQLYANRDTYWKNGEVQKQNTATDYETSEEPAISYNQNSLLIDRSSPARDHENENTSLINEDCDIAHLEGDDIVDDDSADKLSSSPSIQDEHIDFQFVYALHTFVATTEGQANVTKGDNMILLDDSNSYWWLVRVVKDSSIGYLPAEHIETPTERLARLNKHRNIELSSSMLTDQGEKYVNPLVKAFRKRNTKTVIFSEPTYFEASENDYSTEEEEDAEYYGHMTLWDKVNDHREKLAESGKSSIDPPSTHSELKDSESDASEPDVNLAANEACNIKTGDELLDEKEDANSRNGSLQTTDSLFQYDPVETRKITITPNLLRDDSNPSSGKVSNDLKEIKRPSIERSEKEPPEKLRDKPDRKDKKEKDKKDKDKKSGMLSGLFKRKDKRIKSLDEEFEEVIGPKQQDISPVPSKESDEILGELPSVQTQGQSTLFTNPQNHSDGIQHQKIKCVDEGSKNSASSNVNECEHLSDGLVPSSNCIENLDTSPKPEQKVDIPVESISSASLARETQSGNSISKILVTATSPDSKLSKTKKVKAHAELGDFDSNLTGVKPQIKKASPKISPESSNEAPIREERPSEPSMQSDFINETQSHLSGPMIEDPDQNEPHSPILSSSSASINVEDTATKSGVGSSTSLATTATAWSDSHLRSFFEDDSEIKDLLIIVFDNSGVVPAGPDHPIAGSLFKEENEKLIDIANRLDGILENWLTRKSRIHGGRS